jgi:hypothetical protein
MTISREHQTFTIAIEHAITTNAPPFDQPWPPTLGDRWHLVRALPESKTLWRRVSLVATTNISPPPAPASRC